MLFKGEELLLKHHLFIFGCSGSSLLCCFSLVAMSRGYFLGAVLGLLIVVVSLVAEPGFRACGFRAVVPRLESTGSIVVVHGLSCSTLRGIFPEQGLNLGLFSLSVINFSD